MPRDSQGNYTKPNPSVVAGTTVQAAYENTNTDDQATELTDSLSRSGKGAMLEALKCTDDGFVFASELTSGIRRAGAGDVRARVIGTDVFQFMQAALQAYVKMYLDDSGAAFQSEQNSGIKRQGAGDVRLELLGQDLLRMASNQVDLWDKVLSEFRPALPPYKMVPNGATEAELNAIITGTYSVIVFEPGTAITVAATQITTVPNRVIIGYGATITATAAIGDTASALRIAGAGTKLFGLAFRGETGATPAQCVGIQLYTVDNLTVKDCDVRDFTNAGGIRTEGTTNGHLVADNYVENCAPVSLGGDVYGSMNISGSRHIIRNNKVIRGPLTGISASSLEDSIITGNYIEGDGIALASNGKSGGIVIVIQAKNVVISNNVCKTGAVEGIQVVGANGNITENVTISNNVIKNYEFSGITLYSNNAGFCRDVTVEGNHIRYDSATARAIELKGPERVLITGNYVHGYSAGIEHLSQSPDISVVGNYFYDQQTTAIAAYSRRGLVANNLIWGKSASTTGIIFQSSAIAGGFTIEGNQIRDCLVGITGDFTSADAGFVYNNKCRDCATEFSFTGARPDSHFHNRSQIIWAGTATLAAGTVVINNIYVQTNERIGLYWQSSTDAGNVGSLYISAISAGGGFTVKSTNAADVSTFGWAFLR